MKTKKSHLAIIAIASLVASLLMGCTNAKVQIVNAPTITSNSTGTLDLTDTSQTNQSANTTTTPQQKSVTFPEYTGDASVILGKTMFSEQEKAEAAEKSYIKLNELDALGRTQQVMCSLSKETMPKEGEVRGNIGNIKPSGWHTVNYHELIDGNYLYNRCHLAAWCLTGLNDEPRNLITGTRYLNIEGMLPFEEKTARYLDKSDNHVLYRVTPIYYNESNLVASYVRMEIYSIEDSGAGLDYDVLCYNVQPKIIINYETGESCAEEEKAGENAETAEANNTAEAKEITFVLNTNSKKFHLPSCDGAAKISEKNKKEVSMSREEVISLGYSPCGGCNP